MQQFSLRYKIFLSVFFFLALLIGETGFVAAITAKIYSEHANSQELADQQIRKAVRLQQMTDATSVALSQYIILIEYPNGEDARAHAEKSFNSWIQEFNSFSQEARRDGLENTEKLLIILEKFKRLGERVIQAAQKDPAKATGLWARDSLTQVAQQQSAISAYVDAQRELFEIMTEKNLQELNDTYKLIAASVIAVFIFSVFIAYQLVKSIESPIRAIRKIADRIKNGDLSEVACSSSKDELGHLQLALIEMQKALAHAIDKVRLATEAVASSSTQIAHRSQDLNQRTDEQNHSLMTASNSINLLRNAASHNAESVLTASRVATATRDIAVQGAGVVSQTIVAMNDIQSHSKKITEVISFIEDISAQTNILALNAAVEAARAGHSGLGFAVVSKEVRELAQKTTKASAEIKSLIQLSNKSINNGSNLVDLAGKTISDMVKKVQEVNTVMQDISTATQKQIDEIQKITDIMNQMNHSTQANAELASLSENSAHILQSQARNLNQAVSVFRLKKS